MNLIYFAVGYILGLGTIILILFLHRWAEAIETSVDTEVKTSAGKGKVEFIDPVSFAEKFKNAESIDDVLK